MSTSSTPGQFLTTKIVERCGILDPLLWNAGDSVMADGGFTIEGVLESLKVRLNIPAFLEDTDQLEQDEVVESQTSSAVRIHVERMMSRIKKFKLLKSIIPLTLHESINQAWTVACFLCNFKDPLIKPDKPVTSS